MASDGARRLAARVWRQRRAAELDAADRFARLAGALPAHAVDLVPLARDASSDELRHADICDALIRHFGEEPGPRSPSAAHPLEVAGLNARETLLYEMVALSCVTETLSTALLGALTHSARDEVVRSGMHEILRDEVRHSRLGWAYLAREHGQGAQDVVGARLPAILAATVRDEIFSGDPEHPLQDELSGLGALSRAERLHIFTETMTQVVFPGLAKFDVDVALGERWLAAKRG